MLAAPRCAGSAVRCALGQQQLSGLATVTLLLHVEVWAIQLGRRLQPGPLDHRGGLLQVHPASSGGGNTAAAGRGRPAGLSRTSRRCGTPPDSAQLAKHFEIGETFGRPATGTSGGRSPPAAAGPGSPRRSRAGPQPAVGVPECSLVLSRSCQPGPRQLAPTRRRLAGRPAARWPGSPSWPPPARSGRCHRTELAGRPGPIPAPSPGAQSTARPNRRCSARPGQVLPRFPALL